MYQYRKLTPEQQAELVQQRLAKGFPPHSPPHPIRFQTFYLLTAACYEHKHHLSASSRRQQLLNLIFEKFISEGLEIRGWVILSNHYHFLVYVTNFEKLGKLFNLIHGSTSRQWNLEDNTVGRKVWYCYSDRAIRSVGEGKRLKPLLRNTYIYYTSQFLNLAETVSIKLVAKIKIIKMAQTLP